MREISKRASLDLNIDLRRPAYLSGPLMRLSVRELAIGYFDRRPTLDEVDHVASVYELFRVRKGI
jgi:hypothetical protein